MKGCCPFHKERTPSFYVVPQKQIFHCFGCDSGGSAFNFLMKLENLTFVEAAEKLASRVGIKIEADKQLGPEEKARIRAREALEFAADFYHQVLKKDPSASAARQYVAKRKLSGAMVDAFQVGFAPREGGLLAAARKKGFDDETLLKAGLIAKRDGGGLREFFFDRVLFPIRDLKGAVVGFGGRTMGDGAPKYLNSSDSQVFSKGRNLYGFHEGLASVRKAKKALLMEGYMDVIAAHQYGFTNACAPLGTALTPEQAALLKKNADSVVIVFDADEAGLRAAIRGSEIALQAGLNVRLTTVLEGKDPDELLQSKGAEAFERTLAAAKDPAEFKTNILISKETQPLTPEAKSEIARSVLVTIGLCGDEVLKDEWTRNLASRLGVSEDSVKRMALKTAMPAKPMPAQPPLSKTAPQRPEPPSAPAKKSVGISAADLQLLALLMKAPAAAPDLSKDDFDSEPAWSIVEAVRGVSSADKNWGSRLLDSMEDAALKPIAARLLAEENLHAEPESHFRYVLDRRRKDRRYLDFKKRVNTLSPDEMKEYMKLMSELRGSKTGARA